MGLDEYTGIGKIFAIPVAIVAFIGGWWYATATYGFQIESSSFTLKG